MANPGTPGTPGAPGEPPEPPVAPEPATPQTATPLTKEQLEAQLKNPDGSQKLLQSKFARGEPQYLYKNFKDVVKDKPEMGNHEEFETHWISKLGDYNGIQVQIDNYVEQKKRLTDDRFIQESPDFKAEFKKVYQEMLQTIKLGKLKVDSATIRRIQENAKEEVEEKYKQMKRAPLIKAIDAVLASLKEKREKEFRELMEYMSENLKLRVIHLIKIWQVAPPHGYEDVQEAWIEYCVQLLEALDKTDYKTMDLSDPAFPYMDEGFKEAKNWWYSVSLFEDTYKDFTQASKQDISKETLVAQFKDLEHAAEHELTPEKIKNYQEKMDKIVTEIDSLIPILEKKKNDKTLSKEERALRESEIFAMQDSKKKLLEKRDIKGIIHNTLYSEEVLTPFERSGVKLEIKKGLKHQLDFFDKAPFNSQERRLMLRSLNDGMKEMKLAFEGIEVEADVKFVTILQNLDLYRQNLGKAEGKVSTQIIWINPFEAATHIWESITKTVKDNLDTEQKRGAGYLQKQGTKWMASVPNPTNSLVIKSFKEFSANGEQEAEHAEHGRVGDLQKGYEGFNTEHLYHLASETEDRWEFKACLNLLADRGRINWYDPWIYKQLNRKAWQRTVKLPEDPNWHRTYITASDDLLRQAFVYIYRVTDDYKNLKNKNNSSWESKKGEFEKGLGLLAAETIKTPDGKTQGGLKNEADKLLNQFLDDHHKGIHFSKADPIKYEAIICYAIKEGKMQGEDRMYYINQGIASGFLPFDRGAELTKLNNTYPPVDRYDAGTERGDRPTIDDVKEWACHDKVTNIYDVFETLSDNTSANQRANKTISQGQNRVDHDDAPMLAGHIDAETLQRILSANGQGGYGLPATGLQSLVVGHELWMDMYAHRYGQKQKSFNDAQLSRFATMFMRFDGITSRQMYANQTTFYRLDDTVAKTTEPRAAGLYKNLFGHETLRKSNKICDYIGSVKGYLEILDFDPSFNLIAKLNNKELRTPEAIKDFINEFGKKHTKEVAKKIFGDPPVDNIDKMYEVAIPAYVTYITEKHPDRVQLMVNTINADHKKVWDAQDAARAAKPAGRALTDAEKSLTYRLQEVAKKQHAVRAAAYSHAQGIEDDGHGDHGDHGDHGEESHGGGAAHHRSTGWDDDDRDEIERRTRSTFSRRDHQNRASRSTY